MKLASSAFQPNQRIPSKYTGEGEDISPPLEVTEIPADAQTLALIVDDPDAPMGTFDHWISWNISPEVKDLREGASVPSQGKNDFGELRYRGPMPPPGAPHRYFFKLFALDTELSLPDGSTKSQVEQAMQGHVLEQAELIGTYQR